MSGIWYWLIILFLLLVIGCLILHLRENNRQIAEATAIVKEIASGNMDRRIIISDKSPLADLCYTINDVAIQSKAELIKNRQAEHSYRQLATSLSHDIRTPLTSLTGYLEAIQLGIVSDAELEDYINISLNKALDLKYYVDTLFEWLKLESGERVYHLKQINIYEYAREVIADWVPQFEKNI